MKTLLYCNALKAAPRRLFGSALLGLLLLPGQSFGQAANSCNLVPNPDFELQNVSQLTGQPDNVQSPAARYNELTGWRFSGFVGVTSNGKPTYHATNAPTGTLSNPFTNNPNSLYTSPSYAIGIPFTPYQYSTSPGVKNGSISITAVKNSSSPITGEDRVSPTSRIQLNNGHYYASFQAYKGGGGGSYYIGMQVGSKIVRPPQELGAAAWTRVSGILDFTDISTPTQVDLTIGHFPHSSDNTSNRARFHIDEVELYKIPTAGPAASCSGSSVVIGEGCPIPGASYEWRIASNPNPISRNLFASVNLTGTYTLKVTLPDNTTFSSSVAVTGCNPLPTISGPDFLCPGSSATYTANNGSVVWGANPASFFSFTSGYGPSFTTGLTAGASGQGTITATFINLTGTPVVTKTVGIAMGSGQGSALELTTDFGPMPNPQNPSVPNNYDDYCYSQTFAFAVPAANTIGATGFQWTVSGYNVFSPNEVSNYQENGPTMSFVPHTTSPGTYRNVNVSCVISYGNCAPGGSYRSLTISSQDENGNLCMMSRAAPPQEAVVAYPNPTAESLTVPKPATNGALFNSQGKAVRYADKAGNIDVRGLPEGLYNLRMKQGGKTINQHIEVKH